MAYNPKRFSEYLSEETNEITFVFGRFNPPTNGHEKVFDALKKKAGSGQFRIYASQSNDPKKNPLKFKDKIKFLRKMFPKYARSIMADSNVRTVFDIVTRLYDQGFTKVNMVVGEDRLNEFDKLLNKYNGEKGRHGFYQFEGGIQVVSAGARDPDSDDVSGMSASKLRAAASANDFNEFSKGMPSGYKDGKELFNAIRKGMGLKESHNHRTHVQLETVSEEREQYKAGKLFDEGDTVVVKESNDVGTITMTGANYVLVEFADGKKKRCWLDSVEKLDEAKDMPLSKHTKKYKKMFGEEVKVNKIYHTSGVKTKGQSTPMWFALELKHALDGWLPNRVEDGGQGFVYETKPKGNIAQEDDPKVKKLFKDAKEDLDDYTVDLVENPTAKEVLAMKGTKLLMDNGYSGLVYSDYDPRDFQKDLPAIIIFNPKKNSSPFKLIKTATESFKEDLQEKKIAGLVKKAEKTGMPYGILKKVYDRGMGAWKTSHRPGTTPQQWAFARVNSFVTKSKGTWGGADKDLASKVESYEIGTDEYTKHAKEITPGELSESPLSDIGLPDLDRYLDRVLKKPVYKKAVRYYLDQRKKSSGDTDNASKIMKKTAKVTGLDYRNLNKTFHDMIKKGLLPKHLAFEDTAVSFKDYLKDNNNEEI